MKELAEAIERHSSDVAESATSLDTALEQELKYGYVLRSAGIQWAGFCLRTYSGEAIELGVAISVAISKFCNFMEDGK